MAYYTIKAWNNEGPLRVAESLTWEAALSKAQDLRDQGYTHIALTGTKTGHETELKEF